MGQKRLQTVSVTASIQKGVPSWSHPSEVAVQNGESLRGTLFDISYVRRLRLQF
jgi:hypothetical protein